MTRNQPPIQCTPEQLRRLYPEPIPTVISQLQLQIKDLQQQFLGEDITKPLYEQFIVKIPKMQLDESSALFALSFAIPTKNAVEISMENPPNHYRNQVYKLVRDKKELIGIKPVGQVFLNYMQVTQFVEEFHQQKLQIQPEVVMKSLKLFADRILGESQWDKTVLTEGYINNVMNRIRGSAPGNQAAQNGLQLIKSAHDSYITVKMQDVQRQVQRQQRELMKYASYKQEPNQMPIGLRVPEEEKGVGSININDPDSD